MPDETCKTCNREIYFCSKKMFEEWHHYRSVYPHHAAVPEEEDLPLEQIDGR